MSDLYTYKNNIRYLYKLVTKKRDEVIFLNVGNILDPRFVFDNTYLPDNYKNSWCKLILLKSHSRDLLGKIGFNTAKMIKK